MSDAFRRRFWYIWRKAALPLLAFVWCLCLFLGIRTALQSEGLAALLRHSVRTAPSLMGLLSAAICPFLLSGLAVYLSETWLLMMIAGVKAFCFGFCACGTILAFGDGGWLVRFLFLFSDYCLIPLLLFYWVRHIQDQAALPELCVYLITAVLICFVDYWVISPFLVSILR